MLIEVHAICWNEAKKLPLFLNHYSAFADKIIVWDHHSTDGSAEIVRTCGTATAMRYGMPDVSSEREYLRIKNNMWKRTESEWVIVCDVDELITHRNPAVSVRDYLAGCGEASVLRCVGYDIFGRLSDSVNVAGWRATRSEMYDKPAAFRSSIGEINYGYGAHVAFPNQEIKDSDLLLLHCRYLGGWYDILKRYRDLAERQCDDDVAMGCASRYRATDCEIVAEYAGSLADSIPLMQVMRCE